MIIQIREYATITCDKNQHPTLDVGVVSEATFNWLLDLQQSWKSKASVFTIEGRQHLKLCSCVGYLQSPSGEGIEILPKTEQDKNTDPEQLRSLLQRMLKASLKIKPSEAEEASLRACKQPLHEWIISEFLRELAKLVRRGLRFDYQNIEDECRFVRGQMDINKQLRQTPDKATRFHVRYAEFTPQRLENRLLRSALDAACKLTKTSDNWRLANTLRQQLIDIQPHDKPLRELHRWDNGKQLVSYQDVKPWCQLVLESLNPHFQQGARQGIALLFPMERLFETYVGQCLRPQLSSEFKLKEQAQSKHLMEHLTSGEITPRNWFTLKPDFLIINKHTQYVLDSKWKLLDQALNDSKNKYQIKQADLYQMFAYGHKYLGGRGQLVLIYPKHKDFNQVLPVFNFDKQLSLWCVPFDLETGLLERGSWMSNLGCFDRYQDHLLYERSVEALVPNH